MLSYSSDVVGRQQGHGMGVSRGNIGLKLAQQCEAVSVPKGVGEPTEAQKQAAEAQLTQMIAQFDSDKDGKVSKEEWNAFFGNVFDTTVAASLQHQP